MTFWKEQFSEETLRHIQLVKNKGLNLWPLMGTYKRRSKLSEPIPDEVVQKLCRHYLKADNIRSDFPYFLRMLELFTREHFAEQNKREHQKYKNEPVKLKIQLGGME